MAYAMALMMTINGCISSCPQPMAYVWLARQHHTALHAPLKQERELHNNNGASPAGLRACCLYI
jgi:hypothetical protein